MFGPGFPIMDQPCDAERAHIYPLLVLCVRRNVMTPHVYPCRSFCGTLRTSPFGRSARSCAARSSPGSVCRDVPAEVRQYAQVV